MGPPALPWIQHATLVTRVANLTQDNHGCPGQSLRGGNSGTSCARCHKQSAVSHCRELTILSPEIEEKFRGITHWVNVPCNVRNTWPLRTRKSFKTEKSC